jgi:hypothetical protein
MATGRTPRRAAAANKKYTIDAFDAIKDLVVASVGTSLQYIECANIIFSSLIRVRILQIR